MKSGIAPLGYESFESVERRYEPARIRIHFDAHKGVQGDPVSLTAISVGIRGSRRGGMSGSSPSRKWRIPKQLFSSRTE